jgi:hypothetical protein
MSGLPKGHVCLGCIFNIENKRCADIKEIDANCDECNSNDVCLNMNPKKEV